MLKYLKVFRYRKNRASDETYIKHLYNTLATRCTHLADIILTPLIIDSVTNINNSAFFFNAMPAIHSNVKSLESSRKYQCSWVTDSYLTDKNVKMHSFDWRNSMSTTHTTDNFTNMRYTEISGVFFSIPLRPCQLPIYMFSSRNFSQNIVSTKCTARP